MQDIIDTRTYPLDLPGPALAKLVDGARTELAEKGMFSLPGFMHAGVAAGCARALAPKFGAEAFRHAREHNIYFQKSVPGLAPDHPALRRFSTSSDTLCWDQMAGTAIDRLYRWPAFAGFLAATMGLECLHPMADPLAGLNAMSYGAGQALNWHFDRSEFTTTLLLQAAEEGGAFVYRRDLRTPDDPNYAGVARLLAGDDPNVREVVLAPGTLNVFRGRNTPHRVIPVRGAKNRVIAVFSFFEEEGRMFTEEERIGFYGRAR